MREGGATRDGQHDQRVSEKTQATEKMMTKRTMTETTMTSKTVTNYNE